MLFNTKAYVIRGFVNTVELKNLKVGFGAGGWKFTKQYHGRLSQLQGLQ